MREFGGFVGWLQRKKEGRWLSWSLGCWSKKEGHDRGVPAHVSPQRPICCAGPSTPGLDRVSRWVLSAAPFYLGLCALHPGSFANTVSTRAAVGRTARPLSGAAPWSIPSLGTFRYQKNCDLSSLPPWLQKSFAIQLGLFCLSVRLSVWRLSLK